MEFGVSHFSTDFQTNYSKFSLDATVKETVSKISWGKAAAIVSLSILITGVVCLIIAALVVASPSLIIILSTVGSKLFSIGLTTTLVTGATFLVTSCYKRHKKRKENEFIVENSPELKTHTIETSPGSFEIPN